MGVVVHGFRWKLSRMRNEGGASPFVMNSLPLEGKVPRRGG